MKNYLTTANELAQNTENKAKKRRIMIALIVSALVLAVLWPLIAVYAVAGFIVLTGEKYTTTDISQYGIYDGHITNELDELQMFTLLPYFPKTLTEKHKVEGFYYYCDTKGLDNTYQIYLSYSLPQKEFLEELDRLNSMQTEDGPSRQYDTVSFEYPAYYKQCNFSYDSYEYILVDEANHRFISVLSIARDLKSIPMEDGFLPQEK